METPPGNENFYGVWIPGCGVNHAEDPNISKISNNVNEGINMYAIKDIKAGCELFIDYRVYPEPPEWARNFAKQHKIDMVFRGFNEFVK